MNLDNEKERLRKFLLTTHELFYTLLCIIICAIIGFTVGRLSKSDPEQPMVKIDTVFVEKPVQLGGTLNAKTTVIEEEDEDPVNTKPLPTITPYKVSDIVCAWGKWTGVVKNVHWSERNPDANVLVFEVAHYSDETGEWYEEGYYATELTPGKCN